MNSAAWTARQALPDQAVSKEALTNAGLSPQSTNFRQNPAAAPTIPFRSSSSARLRFLSARGSVSFLLSVCMSAMSHVFLSYSRADAAVARAVSDAAAAAGASVFFDECSLEASSNWYSSIVERVAEADVVFVLVSQTALASRYVNQEIGMARLAGPRSSRCYFSRPPDSRPRSGVSTALRLSAMRVRR
jgi:TIR domain